MGGRGRLTTTVLGVAAAAVLSGAVDSAAEPARTARTERLVSFNSCREYLEYVKPLAVDSVHAFGFGGPTPVPPPVLPEPGTGLPVVPTPSSAVTVTAPAAPPSASAPTEGVDYSGTNVQETGVDEPDLVKTDGSTLFVVANGRLSAVDVREPKPRLLDSMRLADAASELLLHRDRLLVLSSVGYQPSPFSRRTTYVPPYGDGRSTLIEIDVSDPKRLQRVRTLSLDGFVIGARLVEGTVRLVSASQIPGGLHCSSSAPRHKRPRPTQPQPREPHDLRGIGGRGVAADVPDQATGRPPDERASTRAVPARAAPLVLRGSRHGHRGDGGPRQGPGTRQLDGRHDRLGDRLRLAPELVRRDRAWLDQYGPDGVLERDPTIETAIPSSTSRSRIARPTAAAAASAAL